jgi:hypothetical protein
MIHKRRDHVVFRRIAGETLLIPIRGKLADLQRLFVLEGVGEFIWNNLDGVKSIATLRDEIAEHFDVNPDDAAKDLDEFIAELARKDLISEAS